MAECDVCGNEYDKAFEIIKEGEGRTFDCFECVSQHGVSQLEGCVGEEAKPG